MLSILKSVYFFWSAVGPRSRITIINGWVILTTGAVGAARSDVSPKAESVCVLIVMIEEQGRAREAEGRGRCAAWPEAPRLLRTDCSLFTITVICLRECTPPPPQSPGVGPAISFALTTAQATTSSSAASITLYVSSYCCSSIVVWWLLFCWNLNVLSLLWLAKNYAFKSKRYKFSHHNSFSQVLSIQICRKKINKIQLNPIKVVSFW